MGLKVAVTGCAGFIGSHLVDELLRRGAEVVGLDNFSAGSMSNLEGAKESGAFDLIEGDILCEEDLDELMDDVEAVYHLAANPDVRVGIADTKTHLNQNILGTSNVLEAMRRKRVGLISFTSTSAVYGDALEMPTPEDYGPMKPISLYGASKLSCEALISSYCNVFDFRSLIFRFANVVGSRSGHGVIHDFISKLEKDQTSLEILGSPPGTVKSYCDVGDCIEGILSAERSCIDRVGIYNVGSRDTLDVQSIANIVAEEMGLGKVRHVWSGGVDGGRGWVGDVKQMQLSLTKIMSEGWKPKMSSAEAVRNAAKELLREKRG